MKDSKSLGIFKPFKNLGALLKDRNLPVEDTESRKCREEPKRASGLMEKTGIKDDDKMFQEAMADVQPISREKTIDVIEKKDERSPTDLHFTSDEEKEVQNHLMKLVENGVGFDISKTSEYIEGTNYNVHPEILKRLHKGDFSIQAHVDLHGLSVTEAADAFNELFKKATSQGLRGLLIIHGRGLSSPGKPVLKAKVHEWLTSGSWRKWVIAFSSARACDGGAGATYVLLRKNPLTKRHRKKQVKRTNIR